MCRHKMTSDTCCIIKSYKYIQVLVTQSCPILCDLMNYIACQAPLSMEFSRQEYWNKSIIKLKKEKEIDEASLAKS